MLRINDGEYAFTEKKSKFIAYGYGISGRADVKDRIDALRARYPDATHVCYGFIADGTGDDYGYDDDGEPSGTAGKPIWSALAASGAVRSLVAVVRYFGGVKLGAGGLTRAYRRAATELIGAVGLSRSRKVCVWSVVCGGDAYKKASAALRSAGCEITGVVYASDVGFTAVAPEGIDLTGYLAPFGITPKRTAERYENIDDKPQGGKG